MHVSPHTRMRLCVPRHAAMRTVEPAPKHHCALLMLTCARLPLTRRTAALLVHSAHVHSTQTRGKPPRCVTAAHGALFAKSSLRCWTGMCASDAVWSKQNLAIVDEGDTLGEAKSYFF